MKKRILCNSIEEAIHLQSTGGGDAVLSDSIPDADVEEYNRLVPTEDRLRKYENGAIEWNIPEPFKSLTYDDILYIIDEKHKLILNGISAFEADMRMKRLEIEFKEFYNRDLLFLLRIMVYTIYEFERQKVCWGVGRGSSVASYLLFILGVHDIDSFRYRLDMSDFFKS